MSRILAALVAFAVALSGMSGGAGAAEPTKVLRVAFPSDMTGLDPAAIQDTYSGAVLRHIFDTLYVWDYLARPYRFVPSVAAGMPEIAADGRVWTIRIRPGIYFDDDAVFRGQKRELTAADFVYSWKRMMDPRLRSPSTANLEGKLVGLDAVVAKAKTSGHFAYEDDIPGLRAIDRYTLRIELTEPDYTFLTRLDAPGLQAVAREVIEKYADASGRVMDHPVGTGPYRLKAWEQARRVLLAANPNFREERFPLVPANADAATRATAAAMKDTRLPRIGMVDIAIVEESMPRLLMFAAGDLDMLEIPYDLSPKMLDSENRLLPEYARRGVELQRATELSVTFAYFNMEDPVVGGYAADRIAIRRAICASYNIGDEIRVIRNGQGMIATQPIPPDAAGHVRNFKGFTAYDPAVARALLDKFGYRDRDGDGFRELPDGKPFVLHMTSLTGTVHRRFDELWQRGLAAVGIKVDFQIRPFPEMFKAAHAGQLQFSSLAWSDDVADDFMQLFYGPNAGAANLARFRNAQFDELYRKSLQIPEGAERDALYAKMTEMIGAYSPWCTQAFRISNTVVAPSIRGYLKNVHYPISSWHYLDIDPAARKTSRP